MFYSKDSITVRFRLSHPPDVKMDSVQSDSAAALRAAPPALPLARKTERPDSLRESSPSLLVGTMRLVEHMDWPPTLDVYFANTGHSYWANYRLTGDYKLRPTL